MTYIMVSDLVRWVTAIAGLWMIAVLVRIAFIRWRSDGWRAHVANPATLLGLAVFMGIVVSRRFDTLGQPGDRYLWVASVGSLLVFVGVMMTVHLPTKPPWRR